MVAVSTLRPASPYLTGRGFDALGVFAVCHPVAGRSPGPWPRGVAGGAARFQRVQPSGRSPGRNAPDAPGQGRPHRRPHTRPRMRREAQAITLE